MQVGVHRMTRKYPHEREARHRERRGKDVAGASCWRESTCARHDRERRDPHHYAHDQHRQQNEVPSKGRASSLVNDAALVPGVVDEGTRSSLARDLILLAVLIVGVVMWIPALAVMPGTRRLSPTARAGYIFAASLAVTSLSFVWIFARHSMYPDLHHQYPLLHMTPLLDQQ